MPTPAWDNLDDFLQTEDFAVTAVIQLQGGGVLSVVGIYDEPYLAAELGEYAADSSMPRFACKRSAVPGVARGDTITVPEEGEFDIMSYPEIDGTGMVTLRLARRAGP